MQHTFFLLSKQTTFLVLHTFLYISLPFFTSYLHVLRRKCLYCVLRPSSHCFFTATHFHVGIHKHFSFSHRCYIIFMFFFQQNWSPLLFISRSSSFPVIQVNVDIKLKWKERLIFLLFVFSSLKTYPCDLPLKRVGCLKCKLSPQL